LKRAVALVVLLFVATLLVRLPASVLLSQLPAGVQCAGVSGTLWSGNCAQLRTQGVTLADVHWVLHPGSLLSLQPQLDVESRDPHVPGRGHLELARSGAIEAQAVTLTVALPAPPPLPSGWSGSVQAQLDEVRAHGQQLLALRGRILADGLRQLDPPLNFGNFELIFPGTESAPPLHGSLRDRGGPLALEAVVTVSADGAYEIVGTVAARAGTDPQLGQVLALFGAADAQGRHSFSLGGSL
jgi:hypothetical protein